jgi:hypothetical protein
LEESSCLRAGSLSNYEGIPEQRAFWSNCTDAKSGNLDAGKYCRGIQEANIREKIRTLNIAQGSLEESRYYLILAEDLGYADTAMLRPRVEEVSKMLEA